jgi:hypothetical protein
LKKDLKNLLTNQEKCAIIIIPKGERKSQTPPKEKNILLSKGIDTMAKEKKMTKREMFEQIKAVAGLTDEMKAFIDRELELLAKKNSAEKKPTKVQEENKGIKEIILDNLTEEGITITDLQKKVPELGELSNQKISALMRQLVNDLVVVKTEDKRKSYFSLATE